MNTHRPVSKNKLKSLSQADNSSAIVTAFSGKWRKLLEQNKVAVFFRKQGPLTTPTYVYVYAAAPTSGIIGRARVLSHEKISLADAKQIASRGAISAEELDEYALASARVLWATELGVFEPFKNVITRQTLRDEFHCVPPQGFFFLSMTGKKTLDILGGIKH